MSDYADVTPPASRNNNTRGLNSLRRTFVRFINGQPLRTQTRAASPNPHTISPVIGPDSPHPELTATLHPDTSRPVTPSHPHTDPPAYTDETQPITPITDHSFRGFPNVYPSLPIGDDEVSTVDPVKSSVDLSNCDLTKTITAADSDVVHTTPREETKNTSLSSHPKPDTTAPEPTNPSSASSPPEPLQRTFTSTASSGTIPKTTQRNHNQYVSKTHSTMAYAPYQSSQIPPQAGNYSMNIHEFNQSAKFRGGETGITLRAFIDDVGNAVQALGIPATEYDRASLSIAMSRCDREVPRVRNSIEEFRCLAGSRQTWKEFIRVLQRNFRTESGVSETLFSELMRLRLDGKYDEDDVIDFMGQCKILLTRWARADNDTQWSKPCLEADSEDTHARLLIVGKLLSDIPRSQVDRVQEKLKKVPYGDIPRVFSSIMQGSTKSQDQPTFAATTNSQYHATPPPINPRSNPPPRFSNPNPPTPRPRTFQQRPHKPPNNPNWQPSIPRPRQPFSASNNQTHQRYASPRPRISNYYPVNPSWQIPTGSCWRCLRPGHSATSCTFSPRCPWHGVEGHGFRDCVNFQSYTEAALQQLYASSSRQTQSFLDTSQPTYHMEETQSNGPDIHAKAQEEYLQFALNYLAK